MRSNDRQQFDELLDMLGRVFKTEITAELRRDYWDALRNESIDTVQKFAHRSRDNDKHFPRPGDLKPKNTTRDAIAAQDEGEARRERMRQESVRLWDEKIRSDGPIAQLQLADALSARYDCEADQASPVLHEKREWIKQRIAELVRKCEAAAVYGDPGLRGIVFKYYGEAGIARLRKLSQLQTATV